MHRIMRTNVAIPCLVWILVFLCANFAKALSLPNDYALWDNGYLYSTFTIRTTPGVFLSRSEFKDNLAKLQGFGFAIDNNFVYYSDEAEFSAGSFGAGEWTYIEPDHTIGWQRIDHTFVPAAVLHVYRYGDTYISRVCGNFSRNSQNPPPPIITGYKWNDINGNKNWDAGEPGLKGWTINLMRGNDKVDTAVTDEAGKFSFTINANIGLLPGTYRLEEVPQTGWEQTHAPADVEVREGYAGYDYGGNHFGNYAPGKIYGYKYEDIDADGVAGTNTGRAGWQIRLEKDGAQYGGLATTREDGYYEFTNLPAGTYTVKEVQNTGWYPTAPASGEHTGIVITSGAEIRKDFYNFKRGKIYGYKFEDMDADGDAGTNIGRNGWMIQLYKDGQPVGDPIPTRKNEENGKDGYYEFPNLPFGTYTVREVQQDGWYPTFPASGEHTGIVITSGAEVQKDFYNFQYGSISGTKRDDLNEDKVQKTDDPCVPKSTAEFTFTLRKNGEVVGTTTNDEQGQYRFDNLAYGTYTVQETGPDGWVETYHDPRADGVTITSGLNVTDVDFGNFKLGVISALKWDDSNVNGIKDGGETPPRDPWCIELYKDGKPYDKKLTDKDGMVTFDNLHYGSYTVYERMQPDWRQTTPCPDPMDVPVHEDDLGLGKYGPYDAFSGLVSEAKNNMFGNIQLGSITKVVKHYWWDEPMSGFTVMIVETRVPERLKNLQPFPSIGDTDAKGEYGIDSLLPGDYMIKLTLPAGWHEEPDNDPYYFQLMENEDEVVINTVYDNASRAPRTIGFWQNWRNKYSAEEMQALIVRVQAGSDIVPALTIEEVDRLLNTSGKKSGAQQMATTQYLATWLNLASERLGFTAEVNLSTVGRWDTVVTDADGAVDGCMTIHALMKQLVAKYNTGTLTEKQWETFKNICDAVNNYLVFTQPPTGPID